MRFPLIGRIKVSASINHFSTVLCNCWVLEAFRKLSSKLFFDCQRDMRLLATLSVVALAASKEDIKAIYQGKDQKSFYKVSKNW